MMNVGFDVSRNYSTLNSFGAGVVQRMAAAKPPVTDPVITANTTNSADEVDKVDLSNKDSEEFKAHLKDKKWVKKYNPKYDSVRMAPKSGDGDVEYIISADGSVTKIAKGVKPEIILVEDDEALKLYSKKAHPSTLKDKVANVWKFFVTTGKMIGAAVKGVVYGAATGVALLGGSWLFNSLPKAFAKEGPKLWATIRHPLTHISKSGKIIAGIGSALVLGYQLIAGKLRANKGTADVDHQLYSGHRDK
ncbi:MAG: hypothetical protein NC191_05855 [Muribaculaceae bacterium]|nr:hypothetical protein [Muribaculaceae bacterium]